MHHVFNKKAEKDNLEVTWTVSDVSTLCRRGGNTVMWDGSGLLQLLKDREKSTNLRYAFTDDVGYLDLVFTEMPGATEVIRAAGSKLSVMYDTTHGTNHFDCKLGLITTVGRDLSTTMLAVSIMSGDETAAKFEWIFQQFTAFFGVHPNVILTDSCSKIGHAVSTVLPHTSHFLCVWHIFLNFEHHVYNIANRKDWCVLNAMFWRLVKETDARSKSKFQQEFDELVAAVTKAATEKLGSSTHDKLMNTLKWLTETLCPKAPRFAYRYTWGIFTGGAHSTQRSESIHAHLKVSVTL
jgi:hypothetical protein